MKEDNGFISLLQRFTHIPVYEFDGMHLISSVPDASAAYIPAEDTLKQFVSCGFAASYMMAPFSAFYGAVRSSLSETWYLIGPVSSIPYSQRMRRTACGFFSVPSEKEEDFNSWISSLPLMELEDFLSFITYFCYELNGRADVPSDVETKKDDRIDVSEHYASTGYEDKELEKTNNSYYVEMKMLSCVEHGDLEGLSRLIAPADIGGGVIADTMLRQLKNILIVTTTLVSRAAIRGGLDMGTAFRLSDSYILHGEKLLTAAAVNRLIADMIKDYTKRVAAVRVYRSTDPVIFKVIQFVRENVNRHITVADAAQHAGLSTHYLSAYFKKSMGTDLSAFIRTCKLEEARELLTYTDKSLSQISSYLCFSSQSHFQTLFKKEYGITPLAFRRTAGTRFEQQ